MLTQTSAKIKLASISAPTLNARPKCPPLPCPPSMGETFRLVVLIHHLLLFLAVLSDGLKIVWRHPPKTRAVDASVAQRALRLELASRFCRNPYVAHPGLLAGVHHMNEILEGHGLIGGDGDLGLSGIPVVGQHGL